MKKFTRFWQLMMVILLSSTIAFAQTTVQDAEKGVNEKDYLLKQKQIEQSQFKVNPDGDKVQDLKKVTNIKEIAVSQAQQVKTPKQVQVTTDMDAKAGAPAPPADWLFDIQFDWPLTNPTSLSVGIETDGFYIYTCHWQHDTLYRYDMNGNYLGWFQINGVNLMRDMAYNPVTNLFYGAAASTTVWIMDFTPGLEMLVGTIAAPTAIRAIGCDHNNQWLFGNNWSTDVHFFDLTGASMGSFVVGPTGASYYGFAYDDCTPNGPYIWGYAQIDVSLEWLIQMDMTGVETGLTYDVGTALGHTVGNLAGGLAFTPPGTFPAYPNDWSFFGINQNVSMWAIEACSDPNPCATPTALTETNILDNSAELSWTENNLPPATMWDIEFLPSMVAFTGIPTDPGVTNNPTLKVGLTTLTSYHWRVRADCGGGSYSAWSSPSTFATTGGDCMWECIGYDSYGDGWNGGSIDFYVDGGLIGNWAGPATTGPETYMFPINDPCLIDLVWNAGTYDSEVTYEIYDNFGTLVFSDGPNPVGITGLNGYCTITCAPPTNVYADNFTGTTAVANWTDLNAENLYDIVWGLSATFDPDDPLTHTGWMYGFSEPFPGITVYSYPLTGLIYGETYEFCVRTDCGAGGVSFWVCSDPFISAPPPPNDECVNAQAVMGPYPEVVLGTTLGATIDCPGVLDWEAVWYEVTLPYSLNNLNVDYCGTADQATIGIVYYNDCLDCNAYVIADFYEFYDCGIPGGVTVGRMDFYDIPGPTTVMFPVYQLPQQDFTVTFDVTEQMVVDNDFWITQGFLGEYVEGSGTDYYPGGDNGWYYYPNYGWRNIWFYDHPYDTTRYKEIHIEFDLAAYDPPATTEIEFVVNWSTPEWSLIGNPMPDPRFPPIPPLTLPEEDLFIGRYLLEHFVGPILDTVHYAFDFTIPDYNPEWVSIDVRGVNFEIIAGTIHHECLPKPDPPPVNDECIDAINIGNVFPTVVPGTTLGATIDCPGVLDWDAVWYEIELPYECNYIELDLCLDDLGATLNNTGIILTEDCSCDAASFIYSTGTWMMAANCITDLNFMVEGPTTVYYPVMTDPKGDFTFDVNVTELYRIGGKFYYANTLMSPMQLDEVTATSGTVFTQITDLLGDFLFKCLNPGAYTLTGSTTDDCGGLTMADVQMARQYVTGQPPGSGLSGIQLQAGDVDLDGNLFMNDVLAMWQQVTSNPPGFVPFWVIEEHIVNIGPSTIQDIQAICAGDVDASYIPPSPPIGATWLDPIPISYPTDLTLFNQTNCGYYNFEENSCLDYYDGGEDIFYLLTLTSDYTVTITLDPKGTTYTGMLISDDTDFTTCLDFCTSSSGTGCIIDCLFLPAGSYYIMIDTWPLPDCIPDFDLTIEECVPGYCIAGAVSEDEYIVTLNIGTLVAGPYLADGITYHDYTLVPPNPTTDLSVGVGTYPIDVVNGTPYASDQVTVWIDWNQNLSFYDAGEMFTLTSADWINFTGTVTVDPGALLGATRMRVRLNYTALADPCGSPSWGEVHDYTVTIVP